MKEFQGILSTRCFHNCEGVFVHICHLIDFIDKGRCTGVMTLGSSLEAAGIGPFVAALLQQVLRLLHFSSGCSPFTFRFSCSTRSTLSPNYKV